jgi:tetratricopeptide (TPR) repeat protein
LATAEKTLLRALELEPANPEPYLVLILMYERDGNRVQAEFYRDKAHTLYPKIEELLIDRVANLCRLGEKQMFRQQFSDAEVLFWQALKIDPDYIPALIDMGSLRAEQGKPAQAIPYLQRVLALDPAHAAAHYNLSLVYRMQGRSVEAAQEMEKYRKAEATENKKEFVAPR